MLLAAAVARCVHPPGSHSCDSCAPATMGLHGCWPCGAVPHVRRGPKIEKAAAEAAAQPHNQVLVKLFDTLVTKEKELRADRSKLQEKLAGEQANAALPAYPLWCCALLYTCWCQHLHPLVSTSAPAGVIMATTRVIRTAGWITVTHPPSARQVSSRASPSATCMLGCQPTWLADLICGRELAPLELQVSSACMWLAPERALLA